MKYEIEEYHACQDAVDFRKQFDTFKEAWEACPRGDWMLWIAQKAGVNILKLTTAKALCANTVRHLMKDERSTMAIDAAIKFGQKKIGKAKLQKAAYAAYAAANAANVAANANTAANTAAYAVYAAYTAVNTVANAADTASAAAYANTAANIAAYAAYAAYTAVNTVANAADTASAAAYAAAKKENQLQTADICRKILTKEVFKILNIN